MVDQDAVTLPSAGGHMTGALRTRRPALAIAVALAATALVTVAGAQTNPPAPAPTAPRAPTAAAPRAPAPSLTRPTSAPKAPNGEGFLQRWLLLEPLPIPGQLTESAVRSAVSTDDFRNQLATFPRDGDVVTIGNSQLTWRAVDTVAYNVNLYHFAYALNKPTSNVLFSIATVVHAPRDMADVRLAIGSNAASVWWVNGREVISIFNDRQTVIDDGVSKRLTLKRGANVIRAAILNAGGATDFCARLLDSTDRPIRELTVSLTDR
jgi:hypothetical protein